MTRTAAASEVHDRAEVLRVVDGLPGLATPSVIYSAQAIRTAVRGLADATASVLGDSAAVGFSVKCNPRPEVLQVLAGQGCSFVACWPDEVSNLRALGVPAARIYWSGPLKRNADIEVLRRERVTPIVESPGQLAAVLSAWDEPTAADVLGIRLHFTERSRFGVDAGELEPSLRAAARRGIGRIGFQVHGLAGQWPPAAEHWRDRGVVASRACELASGLGLDVAFVSLGGGLPEPSEPSRRAYEQAALPYLAAASQVMCPVDRVLVEPGRFLVQWAGTMIATVIGVRARSGGVQVTVDLSFTALPSPTSTSLSPVFLGDGDRGPARDLTVVGPSDFHGDVLCQTRAPVPNEGDLVALPRVGAYQEAFAARHMQPRLEVMVR